MAGDIGMALSRFALAAALAFLPAAAMGQEWPAKQPIKAIVPFSAGSATDVIARSVLEQVGKQIGQTFIVENRVGAGGTIGANAVAKADPDGYTLLVNSSSHTVTPSTYSKLPYDVAKDFTAIALLANLPSVLVASPAKGYKSLQDLVEAAKKNPGAMNYASAGAGSAAHLTAERFKLSANIQAQHVAFKGAPEALTEIIADRIDFYFCPVTPALSLIKDGKLAALAVSGARRASALPAVPTTVESGYPNSEYEFWIGTFAPRQTPKAITDRLYAEITKALAEPAVAERLAKLGADPMQMTSAEFEVLITREIESNAALVKAAGVKAN
jgi:tripartite-type tricarboxylate transporter receptor subunit TctC